MSTINDKIFLIGNKEEYITYESNKGNTDSLPIKNLPMCYFPFFYNNSEMSIEKMKKIVSLTENYSRTEDINAETAKNNIDTEKLFSMLTILEEPYQPFNNNNIFHIKICIIIFWILVGLGFLKICYYFFKERYTYFMLFMIFSLLIISTVWSLTITSNGL